MQVLAIVPVLIALVLLVGEAASLVSADQGTHATPSVAPPRVPTTVPRFLREDASLATTAAVAGVRIEGLPSGNRPDSNSAPRLLVPHDLFIEGRSRVSVPGILVDDDEARAGGDVGVLILMLTGGEAFADPAPGVRLLAPEGGPYFPMIGPLDAINATLATLEVRPSSTSLTQIGVIVSDFGHGNLAEERIDSGRFELHHDG